MLHPADHFFIRNHILRITTIGINSYGFSDDTCKRHSNNAKTWSEILFDGLHCLCHAGLVDHRQYICILNSFLSLFCPASKHTVTSCTPVTFQSKVYLHLWWNMKVASLQFSWAITKLIVPCQAFHQHSCRLLSLWNYRQNQHFCLWGLSTNQDCLVPALWQVIWLL